MKKLFAMVLVLGFMATMVGCGDEKKPAATTTPSPAKDAKTPPPGGPEKDKAPATK